MKLTLLIVVFVLGGGAAGLAANSAAYAARVEAAFPPIGRRVDVNDASVHVIAQGDAGPPVLMIHGASANAREFEWSLAPMISEAHRVFMADRPGHGYSDRPADGQSLAVQAAQMAGVLHALAPEEPAVIVGHSFGGAVALRVALDFPDLVSGVVLLAPATHDWGSAPTAWHNRAATFPALGWVFNRLVALVGPAQGRSGVLGVFHPQDPPDDYFEKSAIPLLFRPSEFHSNAADVIALRGELAAQSMRYGELDMPIIVFSGAQDTVLKPQLHAGRLQHQARDIELVRLSEGGHMPHHAYGEAVATAIARLAGAESGQKSALSN